LALPIVDRADLLRAIADFKAGAIPESEEADARAFIRMRARLMRMEWLLPVAWQLKAPVGA